MRRLTEKIENTGDKREETFSEVCIEYTWCGVFILPRCFVCLLVCLFGSEKI